MKSFKEYLLKDCLEFIIDHRGKTPTKMGGTWVEKGVRVISALNVHNGSIDNVDQIRCVTEEVYKRWMSEDVKRNDCFIASEGASLGENCIWDSDEKIVLGQRLYALRTNPEILDPWYFACYMQTNKFRTQIDQISTGSTVFGISQPVLLSVKLVLPEINQQRVIGELYKNLKRKIENNNQCNAELEAVARTIYDYWFLQFDFPDENGRPYKSSGGKMVWNEELKREIPEGWEDGIFADFFEIGNGRDHKHLLDGAIPVYGSGGIMRYVDEALYNGESVLIPRKGTLNNIFYIKDAFWTVDTMYFTKMKKENVAIFMYYTVKQYDFEKMNTGTGVPSMTASIIYNLKTVIPKWDILRQFDNKVQSIYDMIKQNEKQNKELVSLRDFLLPLLMNGQVGFKEC